MDNVMASKRTRMTSTDFTCDIFWIRPLRIGTTLLAVRATPVCHKKHRHSQNKCTSALYRASCAACHLRSSIPR
jgi:hypothetical protein